MTQTPSSDIHILEQKDRKIILIGTAHISKRSVELVKETIINEKPDCVCLELDEKRYKSLTQKNSWESLNLIQIIKQKQLMTLLTSLILSSYQKRLSEQTGINPGSEFLEADKVARDNDIKVELVDRDARITLKRAWRKTSFGKKFLLLTNIFGSLFDKTKIDEDSLEDLKKSDMLTEMLNELSKYLPDVKSVLIDERDLFIAEKVSAIKTGTIMAVVGAGHIEGIKSHLNSGKKINIEELNKIPPPSPVGKFLAWSIPALIIGSIVTIGYMKGFDSAKYNVIYWIVANGSFSALGALLALAHPLTILTAFVAAPVTSLTPVIGAGYVTALVQVLLQPPTVKEIQNVSKDFMTFSKWWKNKTLKVFLAFLLPGFGSAIGTWVGGYEIVSTLFN